MPPPPQLQILTSGPLRKFLPTILCMNGWIYLNNTWLGDERVIWLSEIGQNLQILRNHKFLPWVINTCSLSTPIVFEWLVISKIDVGEWLKTCSGHFGFIFFYLLYLFLIKSIFWIFWVKFKLFRVKMPWNMSVVKHSCIFQVYSAFQTQWRTFWGTRGENW